MDFQLEKFLNHLWAGTFIDKITSSVVLVTTLLVFYLIAVILAYFFNKKYFRLILFGVIIAFIIELLISNLFIKDFLGNYFHLFRLQPYLVHPTDINLIGKSIASASSFPSAHMSSVFAVLTVVVYFWRKFWPYALAFALIVAFSLTHNGVHYPSDILIGSVLGVLYGLMTIYLEKKLFIRGKGIR